MDLHNKALQVAFEPFQQQVITKNTSKEINKLSYWNRQQQIPNCHINSEIREIFINCLISCGTNKYCKLQKVTGNSMLRTYEKFGNTLFDGFRGWFAPVLVRKGDYVSILCKKLFQRFNNCNYDQNSS